MKFCSDLSYIFTQYIIPLFKELYLKFPRQIQALSFQGFFLESSKSFMEFS